MTEQPRHGMTMASRGQTAHHPDPKPTTRNTEEIVEAQPRTAPDEDRVERVAHALRAFMPVTVSSNLRHQLSLEAAHAAIAAMEDNPENGHQT